MSKLIEAKIKNIVWPRLHTHQDKSTGAGPASVALDKPSTVISVLCAVNAANVIPVNPFGTSADPTPSLSVTFEYTTGFTWFTHPIYKLPLCVTPVALKVIDVGGVAGDVAVIIGDVRLSDGRMGSGIS
jgi:hypothetical protein